MIITENNKEINQLVIVADNLKIGGIQRIVLDQGYQFKRIGVEPKIIILSKPIPGDHMLNVDREFQKNCKLDIIFLKQNKLSQLFFFCKLFSARSSPKKIICHSATGAFLVKLSSVLMVRRSMVILFIHQLLSFSDKKQQNKRLFYSLFSNIILFSSKQFLLDWNRVTQYRKHLVFLNTRPRAFLRMGVYLPRLKSDNNQHTLIDFSDKPSLIFLSRASKWKGLERFIEICNDKESETLNYLLFSTGTEQNSLLARFKNPKSALTVSELGITSIALHKNSIHIYPTSYGTDVIFPQSIGMNVLEMISFGIVSLITHEDFSTWPEFLNSPLVRIVDWDNLSSVILEIKSSLILDPAKRFEEVERLLDVISIEEHCNSLIQYLG